MLYVSSTPFLPTSFMCHVAYVMLTLPFHGISHMFMVAISQQSVYIPCLQLGEPQLELTCNTSSSLTCCSPQSLLCPWRHCVYLDVINSNNFTLSEHAYVKEHYFCPRRPTKKLAEKYLGPYDLIVQVGTHSFMLKLPNTLQSVHPVFHVSMLKPHTSSSILNHTKLPSAPVKVDSELEYKIAEILDTKIDKRRCCKLLYLVKWLGYEGTNEETSVRV